MSEDNHKGIPRTFLAGSYGESRIRSELYAKSHADKGDSGRD